MKIAVKTHRLARDPIFEFPVATPALAILRASRRLPNRRPSTYRVDVFLCGPLASPPPGEPLA